MSEAQAVINITGTQFSAVCAGVSLGEIRTAIPELEAACNRALEASEDFSTMCQLVGLKAGLDPSVVKTFISVRCKETEAKAEKKAEQLSLLFDEFPHS